MHFAVDRRAMCQPYYYRAGTVAALVQLRFVEHSMQAVFDVRPDGNGLILVEKADGVDVEEIANRTEASFEVSENLRPMLQSRCEKPPSPTRSHD
jgi:acyl CoA:acetate/3-ketoacid CoA transferase